MGKQPTPCAGPLDPTRSTPCPDTPSTTPTGRRTVAIWGGCATREAFEIAGRDDELRERLPLVHYGARSSWISQASRTPSWARPGSARDRDVERDLDGGLSTFARRTVREDLTKQLVPHLVQHRPDVVVFDLIAERLHLVRVGRTWITSSDYLEQTTLGRRVRARAKEILSVSNPRRGLLFAQAARRLARTLTEQLPDTVFVLNQAPYTTRILGGGTLPEPQAGWARELDAAQQPMFDALAEAFGHRLVRAVPPPEVALADPAHRWGLASYHYGPDYYHWLLDQLLTVQQPGSPPSGSPVRGLRAPGRWTPGRWTPVGTVPASGS